MRAENAGSIVDGNAAAGMLWDVFGADVTALVGVCGGCGDTSALAEAVWRLARLQRQYYRLAGERNVIGMVSNSRSSCSTRTAQDERLGGTFALEIGHATIL